MNVLLFTVDASLLILKVINWHVVLLSKSSKNYVLINTSKILRTWFVHSSRTDNLVTEYSIILSLDVIFV